MATSRLGTRTRPWTARLTVPRGSHASAIGWRADLFVAALGVTLSASFFAWLCSLPSKQAKLSDFYHEAWPSYQALLHGHVLEFIRLAPGYFGSLVLRAPFALIAGALGGHSRAVAFATGLPCLAAAAIFVSWLSATPRRGGEITWHGRITPVLLIFATPIFEGSLIMGHPEEVLGAVLCVLAVILASRGHANWCGVLLGLAIVNKTSALVAVPVAFAVLPKGSRLRSMTIMAIIAGAVLAPL